MSYIGVNIICVISHNLLLISALTTRQFRVYALAHEREADDGRRDGPYGGTRESQGPQQGRDSEVGQAGRASSFTGPEGACPPTRAPECWQEPSRVCGYFRGFGPYRRTSRRTDQGERRPLLTRVNCFRRPGDFSEPRLDARFR